MGIVPSFGSATSPSVGAPASGPSGGFDPLGGAPGDAFGDAADGGACDFEHAAAATPASVAWRKSRRERGGFIVILDTQEACRDCDILPMRGARRECGTVRGLFRRGGRDESWVEARVGV